MDDRELKINARGLSTPGPRLMVEQALEQETSHDSLRVVVSNEEAVEDLKALFRKRQTYFEVDQIGHEYHIIVDLASSK